MATGKYNILVMADVSQAQKAIGSLGDSFNSIGHGLSGSLFNIVRRYSSISENIGQGLQKLGVQAGTAMKASGALAVASIAYDMAQAIAHATEQLGYAFIGIGSAGINIMAGQLTKIAEAGGAVEASVMRMKSLGGLTEKAAFGVMSQVQKIVEYTPYMEKDVTKVAEILVNAGIGMRTLTDESGKALTLQKAQAMGISKVSEDTIKLAGNMQLTTASTLLDLAAATGNVTDRQFNNMVYGFRQLFSSGESKSLKENLGFYYKGIAEAANKAKSAGMDGAERANEIYKYIQETLSKRGQIGFSAEISSSMEGIISNYKEIPERLYKAIADPESKTGPYAKIKAGLIDLFNEIKPIFTNAAFLNALKSGVAPIIEAFSTAAKYLGRAIKQITDYIGNNPGIVKAISQFVLWGSILSTVGGAVLVVVGVLAYLGLALTVVGGIFLSLITAAGLLPLAIGLIPIAIAGVIQSVAGLDGAFSFFRRAWTLVSALGEAIQNWGDGVTSISAKTSKELGAAGLTKTFFALVDVLTWVDEAWKGFVEGVTTGAEKAGLGKSWDEFRRAAEGVWHAIDLLMTSIGAVGPATGNSVGEARGWLDIFVSLTLLAIEAIIFMLDTMTALTPEAHNLFQAMVVGAASAYVGWQLLSVAVKTVAKDLQDSYETMVLIGAYKDLQTGYISDKISGASDAQIEKNQQSRLAAFKAAAEAKVATQNKFAASIEEDAVDAGKGMAWAEKALSHVQTLGKSQGIAPLSTPAGDVAARAIETQAANAVPGAPSGAKAGQVNLNQNLVSTSIINLDGNVLGETVVKYLVENKERLGDTFK